MGVEGVQDETLQVVATGSVGKRRLKALIGSWESENWITGTVVSHLCLRRYTLRVHQLIVVYDKDNIAQSV